MNLAYIRFEPNTINFARRGALGAWRVICNSRTLLISDNPGRDLVRHARLARPFVLRGKYENFLRIPVTRKLTRGSLCNPLKLLKEFHEQMRHHNRGSTRQQS